MTEKTIVFLDTNVVLYLLSADARKADISKALLADEQTERCISTQVIGEFVSVARRKNLLSWDEIGHFLSVLERGCRTEPLTFPLQQEALALAERYRLSWYDAVIVATAMGAGARILYSEDFQHDQRIDGVRIVDPYRLAKA